MNSSTDILIIGGGVTGLTTALCLAQDGASVTVLDRQRPGQEASWAGAGMLPPGNQAGASTPESRLRAYSHTLWSQLSDDLRGRDDARPEPICGCAPLSPALGARYRR